MKVQPGKQSDLHGSAPDNHPLALIIIDVINDFDYPRGEELLQCALPIAPRIAELKRQARLHSVPTIYVNDNFGRWQSDFTQLLATCLSPGARGRTFVEQLKPEKEDYFVLKPKHSGFFQTPLELLLKHLGSERLILTGLSSNSCVLFTASDAYMRDLELHVPPDAIAACSYREHEMALEEMRDMLKADLTPSDSIDFETLARWHR